MSLGIVIKGPEGLVLAAESRVTLTAKSPDRPDIQVNFDNATKLLTFADPHNYVAAVTYGEAAIGLRTAHSFIPEMNGRLPTDRIPVDQFAATMSDFFADQWATAMTDAAVQNPYRGPGMTFVVGGFDAGSPYGRVFEFKIPGSPTPVEHQAGSLEFGITWGGQRETVDRLLQGYDARVLNEINKIFSPTEAKKEAIRKALAPLQMPIPLQAMPLQDCVDLAIFFIRTTISAQELTVGIRGCGGAIDVATITGRDGLQFIQKKSLRGEVR